MVMSDDDDMKKGDNSGDICYFLDDAIPTKVLTFGERPVCVEPEEEKYVQELLTSAVSRQNHCDRCITLLSGTDIFYAVFNLFTYFLVHCA
jgi:hypothetical protein